MIPETKLDAVTRAIHSTFGITSFEEIQPMTAGLSTALVFRIVVKGESYLLRIITKTDALNDPTRQYACMRAGADAGLAPHVLYANVEDRISITGFVPAKPFPREEALVRMPKILRRLHSLPPFPPPATMNYFEAMDGLVHRFQAAKILPDSETAELFQGYERITKVYPCQDSNLVSCHNDLKPENVLFDGENVWLVDWEAAFLNDRYLDLSVVANFLVTNDKEEHAYLCSYFGEEAGEDRSARFFLMQELLHVFYAAIFLLIGSGGKPLAIHEETPEFRGFHGRIWRGEQSLASPEAKVQCGRVHLRQFLTEIQTARFHESVRILSAGRKLNQ